MMGPSHALSGAAVWLAGSFALDHFLGYEQSPLAITVGTAVCAGGALLPDLDMSGKVTANRGGATVAHTFGIVSLFIAECVEKVSLGIYYLTKTRKDPERRNGHRTFTHTLPFCGLLGWGTAELCAHFGRWAVLGVLFFTIGLALRGLFDGWAERAGWVVITVLSAGAAWYAFANLSDDRGYPMLGAAVGVGAVVHLFGDWITRAGVPLAWPLPIAGRRWRMFGMFDPLAIKAGGLFEALAVRGALLAISAFAVVALFFPSLLIAVGIGR